MFQIMQNNQAATAIPVNNAGVLFQMMMLQVVQKMAASMDLFPPVMAPSMLLRTHEPAIGATRQRTDFQMKISTPCLRFPEDCEEKIPVHSTIDSTAQSIPFFFFFSPVCAALQQLNSSARTLQ